MPRPKCANCRLPYTADGIGKNRTITSFCTLACGAEFGERVLRTEPAVVELLLPEDPKALRLTLAQGCGKLLWSPGSNVDGELWGRWVACANGKGCKDHHSAHPIQLSAPS